MRCSLHLLLKKIEWNASDILGFYNVVIQALIFNIVLFMRIGSSAVDFILLSLFMDFMALQTVF